VAVVRPRIRESLGAAHRPLVPPAHDVAGASAQEWAPMGSTRMEIEERIDVEALLKSIGSLQDLQFRQRGLEPATQQVVDAAKTLFKADGAGLMLIGEGEVLRWVTATDPRAQVIEAAQERLGEGPCVEAFERGTLQLIADTGAEERWPDLTRVLRHDGVHAVLSVPVQVAQGTVGSLNFYLAEPHEWDHSERNAAEVYGRLAGALLGSALTAELQGQLIEQLQWALDHRILIEQAKGVLMGREGISADVAYQRMRSAARSSRRPVAEVAQIVVDGGPWGLPRKDS
jgi:transcriptional regulator with GAF, ATPase, and Fis domain